MKMQTMKRTRRDWVNFRSVWIPVDVHTKLKKHFDERGVRLQYGLAHLCRAYLNAQKLND